MIAAKAGEARKAIERGEIDKRGKVKSHETIKRERENLARRRASGRVCSRSLRVDARTNTRPAEEGKEKKKSPSFLLFLPHSQKAQSGGRRRRKVRK